MKAWKQIAPIVGLAVLACSVRGEKEAPEQGAIGSLSLNLTGTDSNGDQYRLRNANFEVSGFPEYFNSGAGGAVDSFYFKVLSSEDDIDARVITERVLPGYYDVYFASNDWYLERMTRNGAERVEQAVLLSSRYRNAYVWDGGTSRINYQFGVDGELIDFRGGDIQIGIGIERPEDNEGGLAGGGGSGGAADVSTDGGASF